MKIKTLILVAILTFGVNQLNAQKIEDETAKRAKKIEDEARQKADKL